MILLASVLVKAQSKTLPGSFEINNLKDESKRELYTKAIENANFEQYRLQNHDVTLKFENGFEVSLLSAKNLFLKNYSINPKDYKEQYDSNYLLPVFYVQNEDQIIARHFEPIKLIKK